MAGVDRLGHDLGRRVVPRLIATLRRRVALSGLLGLLRLVGPTRATVRHDLDDHVDDRDHQDEDQPTDQNGQGQIIELGVISDKGILAVDRDLEVVSEESLEYRPDRCPCRCRHQAEHQAHERIVGSVQSPLDAINTLHCGIVLIAEALDPRGEPLVEVHHSIDPAGVVVVDGHLHVQCAFMPGGVPLELVEEDIHFLWCSGHCWPSFLWWVRQAGGLLESPKASFDDTPASPANRLFVHLQASFLFVYRLERFRANII